jgi:transcriptional regulator with XRE-family HTH domain
MTTELMSDIRLSKETSTNSYSMNPLAGAAVRAAFSDIFGGVGTHSGGWEWTVPIAASATAAQDFFHTPKDPIEADTSAKVLTRLRMLSGLTWEKVAELFSVSSRTIFNWVNGERLTAAHEEKLRAIEDVVRYIDQGEAAKNRALLQTCMSNGKLPLDLLKQGHYNEVKYAICTEDAEERHQRPQLSGAEQQLRAPISPMQLLGALQDRPYPTSGKLLKAKPLKRKG